MEHRPPGGAENDKSTSSSVLGKRPRDLEESPPLETPAMGTNGNRPRGDAIAAALGVANSVAQEHAQWWNPAMRPPVEAFQSSAVGGRRWCDLRVG